MYSHEVDMPIFESSRVFQVFLGITQGTCSCYQERWNTTPWICICANHNNILEIFPDNRNYIGRHNVKGMKFTAHFQTSEERWKLKTHSLLITREVLILTLSITESQHNSCCKSLRHHQRDDVCFPCEGVFSGGGVYAGGCVRDICHRECIDKYCPWGNICKYTPWGPL